MQCENKTYFLRGSVINSDNRMSEPDVTLSSELINFKLSYTVTKSYEELHNLYSSPDIIRQVKSRRMRWARHVVRMGEEREVYKVLVGNTEGKRPLGRPRRRWEDGIRMDLGEIGLGGVDWIRLAQDRDRWRAVVSAVMNLPVLAPRN
jgi:hypothetical protein